MSSEETKSVLPKTQGVGIWNLAEEYWQAGSALASVVPAHSFVRYQLYGQSLELALKAFLVSRGVIDRELRKLGHDLSAVLRKAQRDEAFAVVALTESDIGVVEWLSVYYKAKDFSYLRPGYFRLPPLDYLSTLSSRLLAQVRPLIWRSVKLHIDSQRDLTSS